VSDDDYLYDGTGKPGDELARIERALRPLGRKDGAPVAEPRPRIRGRLLAIAAVAAAAAVVFIAVKTPATNDVREPQPPVVATGPAVREAGTETPLGVDNWIETTEPGRELLVGDVGRITLGAKSLVQVRHVSDETTRLYLARGSLEARVSADARPRFFQVDTDAARCVDLGCRYTLEVDANGVATVRVVTGQVAFETETREVFVPAGAVCVATKERGPGTPRFEDARDRLASAFAAYDGAAGAELRRTCALTALGEVKGGRDTLPVWHLLQDADPQIVSAASSKLAEVAGSCGLGSGAAPAQIRAAWKDQLRTTCW
jgi:hypothetical protein